jgi:two-component system, NtrC family, sensor histidine kinase PilS
MALLESLPDMHDWTTANRKRNLKLYNLYRLIVASILLMSQSIANISSHVQTPVLLVKVLLAYFVFSFVFAAFSWSKRTNLEISLPIQTVIDIGFLLLMMHLFHQNQVGISLLLLITIVFASFISEGRYAIFYAAIASIGILLKETYKIYSSGQSADGYTNAALLSVSCFAAAWISHTLAVRMQTSERLASERGLDIVNLAKINALITQEMPNGVLVTGEGQQLKHFNQQFTLLTGLDDETLTNAIIEKKPLSSIAPDLAKLLDAWVAGGQDIVKSSEAVKLALPNRDLGIRFMPLSNAKNEGAVLFVEDWSQIQTQAHQVKLAALGRLTANIAHEIRNPLSAISHANQLMQEDNTDPAAKRMLQIIADNVQRLDQIIKDVLELNRRDRTNQESIQLNSFISDFYHQFCSVEKIDANAFTIQNSDQTIEIFFDRRHLNQILWNLCKNGWRHSKKNMGSLVLSIKISRNQQFVDVLVTDDGEGIAPSIQSNIFEPFMTTEKTGTGLGLYIARELAEANGAKLNFKTATTGTQFTLNVKRVS